MADKQIQLQNKAKTDNLFPKVRIQDVDNLSTTLDGVVHKSGTETITGSKMFSADVSMQQDLSVGGNATFDNDVSITNANLSVDGNITAANDLKFENELLNPDGDPYLEINSTIPSGATTATMTSIKFDGTYYLPPTVDLSHYVTLDTAQTITANKVFDADVSYTGVEVTYDSTIIQSDSDIIFYCGSDGNRHLYGRTGSLNNPGSTFADLFFDADDHTLNFSADGGHYFSTENGAYMHLLDGDITIHPRADYDLRLNAGGGGHVLISSDGNYSAQLNTYLLSQNREYLFPNNGGTLLTDANSYEEYLQWGGGNKSGEVSPVGMALSSEHSSNRIAYIDPDAISIEYSTDGTNWSSMYMTPESAIGLCTTSADIPVGADVSWDSRQVGSKTRITFTACNGTTTFFYTNPRKMLINIATSGTMTVLVEYRTGTNYLNDGAWETFGTYSLSGWSGWNDIPLILGTLGGGTDQYGNNWQLRLTFINGQLDPNYQTTADVYAIRIFGENAWSTPSNLARIGHLYDYDTSQNAFFPNDVYANNQRLAKITEIPTVNDATITFTQNGVVKGSFSTNQGSNQTIALDGGGGGGGSGLIECSQAYLHSLESNGTLTPGQWYAITDYAPTWSGNGFTMQGHQFDILVLATSSTELNRNVLFRKHAGDTYFHNCDISKWKGKLGPYLTTVSSYTINGYVLDELEDDNGNRCPYDFKNLAYINQTPYGATVSIAKYYTFSEKYNDVVVDVTTELANSGESVAYLAHNCIIDTNPQEHVYSIPTISWIVRPRKICYLRYYWYTSDDIYFGPSCFNISIGVRGTETFQATGGNMSFMGLCDSINIYGYYTMNLHFDSVSYSSFNHPGFTSSRVTNSNHITFQDDAGVDNFTIDQCYYLDIGTTNVYMYRVFMQGCQYLNVRSSSSSYTNRERITLNNITGTSSSNLKTVSITDSNSVYCTNLHSNV